MIPGGGGHARIPYAATAGGPVPRTFRRSVPFTRRRNGPGNSFPGLSCWRRAKPRARPVVRRYADSIADRVVRFVAGRGSGTAVTVLPDRKRP